jgi:hypothetical protein
VSCPRTLHRFTTQSNTSWENKAEKSCNAFALLVALNRIPRAQKTPMMSISPPGTGWRAHLQRDTKRYPGIHRVLEEFDDTGLHELMMNLAGLIFQPTLAEEGCINYDAAVSNRWLV